MKKTCPGRAEAIISQILAMRLGGEPPCADAVDWLYTFQEASTYQQIWEACERGDWMLWLMQAAGVEIPPEWTCREIVAPTFRYAGQALVIAGMDDTLTTVADGLTPEGLDAARAAMMPRQSP